MCVCVGTCGLEDAGIALAVPGGKRLHHTINFLGFARKSEAPQKLPTTAGTERKYHEILMQMNIKRLYMNIFTLTLRKEKSKWKQSH